MKKVRMNISHFRLIVNLKSFGEIVTTLQKSGDFISLQHCIGKNWSFGYEFILYL